MSNTLKLPVGIQSFESLRNEGYVYIAESPLYEITAKNDTYFAYSDAAAKPSGEKSSNK